MEERKAASGSMSTLTQRLKRLAATRTTIDVAQMQFIDIDDLRNAYGERWPREKARITAVASDYISRRLDPEDILIAGEDGFLLVFGERTGSVCETVAQNIAQTLNEFFLGEGNGPPTPSLEATHKEMSLEEIARGFEAAVEAEEPPPAVDAADTVVFEPVWDARHEAITTYHAAVIDGATGLRLPGYQFDAFADDRRSFAAQDELMLKRSEEALQLLARKGRKALVGISFHATSVTNETTLMKLLAIATRLDPGLAPYRVVRFAGITPGFPRLHLERSVALVQGRIPRMSISVNIDEPAIGWLVGLPVSSIGFALPEHTINGPTFVSHVLPRVKSAALQARQMRKQFFVEGAIPPEKAARLVDVGVDLVTSPIVWPAVVQPRGVIRWPASNLPQPENAVRV